MELLQPGLAYRLRIAGNVGKKHSHLPAPLTCRTQGLTQCFADLKIDDSEQNSGLITCSAELRVVAVLAFTPRVKANVGLHPLGSIGMLDLQKPGFLAV